MLMKPNAVALAAKVIFVHGYDHHIDLYGEFFEALSAHGIEVFAFDQRGNGRTNKSKKDYGRTGATDRVMGDLESIIASQLPSQVPLFLLGHSMGGTTILTYACIGPPAQIAQIRGFIGEAPHIDFPKGAKAKPNWVLQSALSVLLQVYPSLQLQSVLDSTALSRDVLVQERYLADPLCHHTFTVAGIMAFFDRVNKLANHHITPAKEVTSVWIAHGSNDRGTDHDASKKWIEELQLEDKGFSSYDGAFHNLHADIPEVKEQFISDVADWILARSR
ncbi:hypothetical protein NQ176_g2797 [Zarea fungicola]|uniref:Uncharacterized protein n=1 Tax=Zarea fungicola TaxID=93591 RepID=A0ACC1NLM9_9HYPO|nr:hypothetical protein NQ176_g2797 [Lecanicillium fungicola]